MWPFKREVNVEVEETLSGTITVTVKVNGKKEKIHRFEVSDLSSFRYLLNRAKVEYITSRPSTTPASKQQSSIWHVLGCMPTTDRTVVEKAFRRMAMVYHPDHGGNNAAFQTLVAAKEKALAKCK